MTREDILTEVLALPNRSIALSVSTGVGKTRVALEKIKSLKGKSLTKVLVVVPVNNLKETWKAEIRKWSAEKNSDGKDIEYTFTTYKSFYKYADIHWGVIIYDEAHHITERVLDTVKVIRTEYNLLLSATLKPTLIAYLRIYMKDLKVYRVKTQEAIDSNILPDPRIILLPLKLNCKDTTETIVRNKNAKKTVKGEYSKRLAYRDKTVRYEIPCTELQYSLDLDGQVEWYKKKAMGGSVIMKNLWLHKAGERLKWLASKKDKYVLELLNMLKNERTITFCASIEQTERLGTNCIHSKNKDGQQILDNFNKNKINHITGVAQLDEGVNLLNCRIGIFANINSSERIQVQRVGKL